MDEFIRSMQNNGLHPKEGIKLTSRNNIIRYHIHGDRAGSLNGWYWLEQAGDILYGAFGSWRHAIKCTWCSKGKATFTIEEKKIYKEREEEEKKERERIREEAKNKAQRIWKESASCTDHPYLKKKHVKAHGLRVTKDGKLLIPLYYDGDIVSLQTIDEGGKKLFLIGGKVKGTHYLIGTETDTIYICEGYSTAASIHQATSCMTVVALNAGNLEEVTKEIKIAYPECKVKIAADNDINTKGNPGLSAALKTGETVIHPPEDNDFNDMHVRLSIDAVRDFLTGKVLAVQRHDWHYKLITGKVFVEGVPVPIDIRSKTNVYLFIKYQVSCFSYNIFTDELIVARCPPWREEMGFSPCSITEEDIFMLASHLETYGLRTSEDTCRQAVNKIAKEESVNPPKEYFDTLKWDKVPRLDKWLTYFMGAADQPEEYLALVGSKWFIGAVSRIYNPGSKFDSVLILEGKQNIGKSKALRTLATFNGESYFLDNVGDIRNKDTLMTMQGKMIIEMAELCSFRKVDNEEIKAFISRQVDEYRLPYGRTVVKRPRFFVIAGSTNETEYLTDSTGNRRYWPVKCGDIDADGLAAQKEQLWAEAIHRFKSGERTWLDLEEEDLAKKEQTMRIVDDIWAEKIIEIVGMKDFITTETIISAFGLQLRELSNLHKNRITTCLKKMGFEQARKDGKRLWRRN